jgi:hypothetical protein
MMITLAKTVFGLLIFTGILLILGTAGADCDGKCMENSLPIGQMLIQVLIGFAGIGAGALGLRAIAD